MTYFSQEDFTDMEPHVLTTRLTVGALFLTAFRMPVVPITAGSSKSFLTSVTLK